jgi:hypothetical protein
MHCGPHPVRRRILATAVAATLAATAFSQDVARQARLALEAGQASTHIEDSIEAFESVSYVVPLQAGQTLQVALASSNLAQVFDIHAPDAAKPVFVGGESGNAARLTAKITGEFVIRVYLLRFAARDGQSARYTMEVKVIAP